MIAVLVIKSAYWMNTVGAFLVLLFLQFSLICN